MYRHCVVASDAAGCSEFTGYRSSSVRPANDHTRWSNSRNCAQRAARASPEQTSPTRSAHRLHRADKRWRVKQEGRDMEGQKLWLPRNLHAGADGRDINLLTGMFALRSGCDRAEVFCAYECLWEDVLSCMRYVANWKFTREKSCARRTLTVLTLNDIMWNVVLRYFPVRFSKQKITQLSWVLYAWLGSDERKLYFPVRFDLIQSCFAH